MHKLIEYICDELEELERKVEKGTKLSMQEIQYMDTLAHAKKNLLKSDEMMEEDYSMADDSYARDGRMRGGSYARGRGSNVRRDSMGRYSRGYGYSMTGEDFRMEIEELMQSAPNERTKQKLREIMSEM